ncbi:MAG: LacI family DNA-binding transcriptional regulator [Caldilineaceae bacterium]
MPITLRDVARKAGVSVKTVSRVVNNQGEISEETRQRISEVIREMGYRPNLVARGLVTQRTHTLGLVVPDITNPFFPEVARGVQDAARLHRYNVFLCNSGEDKQEELNVLHSLAEQGVDGIIISPCYSTGDNLAQFAEAFRPIVTINHICSHPNISMVLTENVHGAKLAVDYLIGKGHRHIGMVAGLEKSLNRARRIYGFAEAMKAQGLEVIVENIDGSTPNVESGHAAALSMLTKQPQLSAIFVYNDLMALGVLQACRMLGRRVPQDCAIVGFDDIQIAGLIDPALTTVHLDKYRLGQEAVGRLLEMLDQPTTQFPPISLEVELVVRQSA